MLSNNGYVRGEYAVIGKTVYAGTKLSDYRLNDDEFTKHYLTTKEYVDSKVRGNAVYSVKSPYTHTGNSITALTSGTDADGKTVSTAETLINGGGYILKSENNYSIAFIEDANGTIGYQTQLELGQQLYSELDNQIYTLIEYGSPATLILVPETINFNIPSTTHDNITISDIITFDKLFNDTVYHKLSISPLNFSSITTYTIPLDIPNLPQSPTPTNLRSYIDYILKNNNEESVSKIISLSSYSGIVDNGTNLLLYETALINSENNPTISKLTCMIDENNIIKLDCTKGSTPSDDNYTNNGSSLTTLSSGTYYLIDYYNKHVVRVILPLSTTGSITKDDAHIGDGTDYDIYVKDLSLIAELNITKVAATSPNTGYTSYTINIRALSSPDSQHITPWVIETPLILNTYKS